MPRRAGGCRRSSLVAGLQGCRCFRWRVGCGRADDRARRRRPAAVPKSLTKLFATHLLRQPGCCAGLLAVARPHAGARRAAAANHPPFTLPPSPCPLHLAPFTLPPPPPLHLALVAPVPALALRAGQGAHHAQHAAAADRVPQVRAARRVDQRRRVARRQRQLPARRCDALGVGGRPLSRTRGPRPGRESRRDGDAAAGSAPGCVSPACRHRRRRAPAPCMPSVRAHAARCCALQTSA